MIRFQKENCALVEIDKLYSKAKRCHVSHLRYEGNLVFKVVQLLVKKEVSFVTVDFLSVLYLLTRGLPP